jgi:hypothetical protein
MQKYRFAGLAFFSHELQLAEESLSESADESESLLEDDESELELSDVSIVGLLRSTDRATETNSGCTDYM